MNDPLPKPKWLERLSTLLLREPEDREQLIELLHSAFERDLLDSDALSMIAVSYTHLTLPTNREV